MKTTTNKLLYNGLLLSFLVLTITSCLSIEHKTTTAEKDSGYYKETHRPQFHFTPEANWMNDPNGMFYFDGTYHLFYQYYPDSTVWGPMHWGHASSENLVTWEHQAIALYPDSLGCIFSGGAVVDLHNTSGFGSNDIPPIVASFTHHNFEGEKAATNDFQYQSLAYSTDSGKHWSKYAGNPVIPNVEKIKDFRDPKIVWHEDSNKWILVLAAYDRVKFYASKNLKDWDYLSDYAIEGDHRLWECPDLIPIQVKGTEDMKWVLMVSIQKDAPNGGTATSYFVGDFDGKLFKADQRNQQWLDWGTDNYAFVTWDNTPTEKDEVLGIGWMSNWQYAQVTPTDTWRSAMTLARSLQLVQSGENYHLKSQPVDALKTLRGEAVRIENLNIEVDTIIDALEFKSQNELIIKIDLAKSTANRFGMRISNSIDEQYMLTLDRKENKLFVDRLNASKNHFSEAFYDRKHEAPVDFSNASLELRIYFDHSSAEIFIDKGKVAFTGLYYPTELFDQFSIFSEQGTCVISEIEMYPLRSIWSQ